MADFDACLGQTTISIAGLPGALSWQNSPRSWNIDGRNGLTISSNAKADWFVDPFDGTVANTAPILLFTPGSDYVLSARVTVKFATKWGAGALMLMGDDHHWAKLSFEYSPDGRPTVVTVVTRGLSDDCNSVSLPGDSVYLRIAKSATTYVFYFSTDGKNWQILRTFSLDTELPVHTGFESQSPAGTGAVAKSRSSPLSLMILIGSAISTNSGARRRNPVNERARWGECSFRKILPPSFSRKKSRLMS